MKAFYSFIILIGFSFAALAQTNNNYPQWQHPVLQQLRVNSKDLIAFYNKDSTAFVTISVVDKKQKTIYWFDCFGYYFDAVPISDKNVQAIITKKITAFKYYDLINTDYLTTITKARVNFQSNGNKAIFTTYEKQLLQISDSIKFPSTLKKLIELDKQKLSVERQIREFHSINPAKIKEDTIFSKTLALQYGLMETSYQQGDSITTYYNRIALEPVYKAVLNNSTASVKYFNRGNELVDEIQLDTTKTELLRTEKTDVFLLYRGWLEIQRYYIIENIVSIKAATKELNASKSFIDQPQFIKTSNSFQSLLSYSSQLLKSTNYKIDYLTTIDRGFVSQCLKKQYQQTTNSLTAGEAYLSTFTRGNKFYELTDSRGNVMAVVTDKKIQHSSNGTIVDYYEPDIVSATDYAPFGMTMPGRKYSQPNSKYRYGFNGKENDKDAGEGIQDYGLRIYDNRLAKFLSVDPLTPDFPELSPYQFASNSPISGIDLDGGEFKYYLVTSVSENGNTKIKIGNFLGNYDVTLRVSATLKLTHYALGFIPLSVEKKVGADVNYSQIGISPTVVPANGVWRVLPHGVDPNNLPSMNDPIWETFDTPDEFSEKVVQTGNELIKELSFLNEIRGSLSAFVGSKRLGKSKDVNLDPSSERTKRLSQLEKGRPKYKKGLVEEVWETAKKKGGGKVIDPKTKKEITWDQFKKRNGQWDMGHKPGKEFKDLKKQYKDGEINWDQFKKEYNNPNNYQPELSSSNRSNNQRN